jgi:hypothetical protein
MRTCLYLFFAVSLSFALWGCSVPTEAKPDDAEHDGSPTGGIVRASDLFTQELSGECRFFTADSAFIGPRGYTLWTLSGSEQTPFLRREAILRKDGGNIYAGYGIVFCEYPSSDGNETMLVAMINAEAQYSVGEATGAVYSPYTSSTWVNAPAQLLAGYGMSNVLAVVRDPATGIFSLSLNGSVVFSFKDQRTPHADGGGEGYIAVISPQESFPDKPVKICFIIGGMG